MIDAISDWFLRYAIRAELREADRLEVEADLMRERAITLRERATRLMAIRANQ